MSKDPLRVFDGIVKPLRLDGATSGSLAGTTFVAKDLYDVRGYRTGAGNPDWERTHEPAARTAPAVERLLAAGATLVGKSCTDELAFSLDGINVHYGTPLNPRFPDRLPGGSSSGSVSAVAAGLVDFAIGTDTSGSIRVPSSYCGVYGFRPSHGAVPLAGVVPLAPGFDTGGWFARDAPTLGRAGRVLLGRDGVPADGFDTVCPIDDAFGLLDPRYAPEMENALKAALGAFSRVRRIRLTGDALASWFAAFTPIKQWEAWQAHGAWIRAVKPDLAPDIRANFESASRVTDEQHRAAAVERERLVATLAPYFGGDTVLCLPSAWSVAPIRSAPTGALAHNRVEDLTLCSIAGLARAPQLSVPVPQTGYAIGLSFIAAPGEDVRLLALAERLARAIGTA